MRNINIGQDLEWLKTVSKGDSMNRIAERSGIPYATINRRFKTQEIPAEEIITIARAYGQNPIEALIQCGRIKEEEVLGISTADAIRLAPIGVIAAEIVRRGTAGIDQDAINDPATMNEAWQKRKGN